LVGGLNTGFSFGVFALLTFVGLNFAIATLIQTALSVLFNFMTLGSLVFGKGNFASMIRFFFVCGIQYAVYTLGIWALLQLEFSSLLAGAIMIVPVVLVSWYLNKNFAFRKVQIGESPKLVEVANDKNH